ncbi:response regulator [Flammeovirga aprica]|uniref:Response regulator n=1 Tax=Flammeovirga aprica JL-4 TaxID=694437 RepID=A0A7X9P175_9BACT|nr:response regulator [Flammeovirga aprica]NME67555.1 response regulator [Flammeovirga aprica JL-4]
MIKEKINVLLIENNPADIRLIKYNIQKIVPLAVFKVSNDLSEIKELLYDFLPNIIFCDYHLDGFSGLEVLDFLKKSKYRAPLIFITGQIHDEELAADTILAGASGYILKKDMKILYKKLLPYFDRLHDNLFLSKIEMNELHKQHKELMEKLKDLIEENNYYKKVIEDNSDKRSQ